ncbi:MAG: cytochrome P450 [Actinomycetota bacterium]
MTDTPTIEYDPFSLVVQTDPYPSYAALRREAPVTYVESLNGYAISRHADVRRVMHDHRAFSSEAMAALVTRPAEIGHDAGVFDDDPTRSISIIGLDGDDHARLRTIVNRGFTPRRMAAMEQEIRAIARTFVDLLVASEASDLQSGFAVPFPTVVIAAMLGVGPDQRDDFRRWSEQMVLAVFEPTTAEQQAEIARSGEQMGEWLDVQIAKRAGTRVDDLISVLLRAELEGGALTHNELEVFVFTLLVAGSITTAYLIGNAVATLAEQPSLLAAVRADRSAIPAVVEESLRRDAPIQMMFRTATEDVDISGTTIPRGATVVPLIASANRDEAVFANPDHFDPQRNTAEHLAFGHGVHFCLGAALARIEARIAIEELLARAPRLEPFGPIERVTSLVFRGPTSVPLRYH